MYYYDVKLGFLKQPFKISNFCSQLVTVHLCWKPPYCSQSGRMNECQILAHCSLFLCGSNQASIYSDLKLTCWAVNWHTVTSASSATAVFSQGTGRKGLTQIWVPETAPALWAVHLIATSLISPRGKKKTSTVEFHNTIRSHCLALLWSIPFWTLNYWTLNVLNTLSKYLLLESLFTVKLKAINFLPTSITEKMVSPKKTALQRVVGLFFLVGWWSLL